MAVTIEKLVNSFIVINGEGKVQPGHDVPMDAADLDTQLKCTVTREPVITRERVMDCNGRFLDSKPKQTQMYRFTWNFTAVKPQILALLYAYFGGAALSPTGTPASEVQTLARTGTVSGGSFTISLTLEGKTATTAAIAWNATAGQVQAAMIKTPGLGNLVKSGDVVVSGDWTEGIVLTFGGRLAKADLPLVAINNSLITGGGSITRTQTTAGDQNFHAVSNSTTDEKAEFSFCLGHKNSTVLPEEYYNAVVERFEPSLPRGGNVGLTVSVLCNYEPVILEGYSIPSCENYLPLKTSDCSIQADSEWKTREISSMNISLNDSVPVDADTFGFDSLDPELLERGDEPAYSINGQVFGNPSDTSDNFAVAVRNEEAIPMRVNFGLPGNRFSLVAPNTIMNPSSNDRAYAGARNRSVISFDGEPARDGNSNSPVKGEAYLDQSVEFLAD